MFTAHRPLAIPGDKVCVCTHRQTHTQTHTDTHIVSHGTLTEASPWLCLSSEFDSVVYVRVSVCVCVSLSGSLYQLCHLSGCVEGDT